MTDMSKNIHYDLIAVGIMLLFSAIAGYKLFNQQFYTTHDGGGHLIRMEEFSQALQDGQFPVRIAKRINHGLGYPFFHFNYPLVYYWGELLHRTGLSYVAVFKTILLVSTFIGGVFMYLYTRSFFNRIAATIAGIVYIIAPYRFLNMYVRGALSEAVGLGLLPVVLFSVEYLVSKKNRSIIPLIISLSLLILSHNITALVGGVLAILYVLVRVVIQHTNVRTNMIRITTAGIVSLVLTIFFWFPVIHDVGLTKLAELREDYQEFFPTIAELIYSPWGFGPWKNGYYPGKMSPQIGLAHTAIALSGLVFLAFRVLVVKSRTIKDTVTLFFATLGLGMFFLDLAISRPIWDQVSLLQTVQLPWRFVGYMLVAISVISAYLVDVISEKRIRKVVVVGIIVLLLYANRNHIRVNRYIDHVSPFTAGDVAYDLSTTSKDEHMPRLAPRVYQTPPQDGELFASSGGEATREVWRSNYHRFRVEASEPVEFRDNTSYFPGWKASVDGQEVVLLYKQDEFQRLRIRLEKGSHLVEFFFVEPLYRKIVNALSLGTLGIIVVFLVWQTRRNYFS